MKILEIFLESLIEIFGGFYNHEAIEDIQRNIPIYCANFQHINERLKQLTSDIESIQALNLSKGLDFKAEALTPPKCHNEVSGLHKTESIRIGEFILGKATPRF